MRAIELLTEILIQEATERRALVIGCHSNEKREEALMRELRSVIVQNIADVKASRVLSNEYKYY